MTAYETIMKHKKERQHLICASNTLLRELRIEDHESVNNFLWLTGDQFDIPF
jgi:hypothetical protein